MLYRFLVSLFVFSTWLFACGGSCLECHPKLKPYIDDKDHTVLTTCISCHDKPSEQGMCGKDCFDCHSREKLYAQKEVQAHQDFKQCIACHKEEANFMVPKPSMSPTQNNTLIQLLK